MMKREKRKARNLDTDFYVFPGATIVRMEGGDLTTDRIWVRWAALNDFSPDDKVIARIRKGSVPRRFRARASPPPASHGRVDGRVQRRWKDYAVVQGAGSAEGSAYLPCDSDLCLYRIFFYWHTLQPLPDAEWGATQGQRWKCLKHW